jgi:hypothetical protein
MALSSRSGSTAESRSLELLEAVEMRWRSALSHLGDENPTAASAELDGAEQFLRELPALAGPLADLPAVAARLQALQKLHAELLDRSRAGLQRVGAQLQKSRLGARTLKAYSSGRNDASLDRLG